MTKAVYKPSQVLRMVKTGALQDPQPKSGRIVCEAERHVNSDVTQSPSFWENGMYIYCDGCNRHTLARPQFDTFEIDLTGERKTYPVHMESDK